MRNSKWNRSARRSGGPRRATIYIPPARVVLVKLCRLLIDEHNRREGRVGDGAQGSGR